MCQQHVTASEALHSPHSSHQLSAYCTNWVSYGTYVLTNAPSKSPPATPYPSRPILKLFIPSLSPSIFHHLFTHATLLLPLLLTDSCSSSLLASSHSLPPLHPPTFPPPTPSHLPSNYNLPPPLLLHSPTSPPPTPTHLPSPPSLRTQM